MVLDIQTAQLTFERRKPKTRRGKNQPRYYSQPERNLHLTKWWDESQMTLLLAQAAVVWRESKAVSIGELAGQSTEYFSTQMNHAQVEEELRKAFENTNFQPITMLEIARRLRQERFRMENTLGLGGSWVENFFDHVIDILGEVKLTLKGDYKSQLKANVRGESFRS